MAWRNLPAAVRIQAVRDVHPDTGTLSSIAAALSARYREDITKNSITGLYNRYRDQLRDIPPKGAVRPPKREPKSRAPKVKKPAAAEPSISKGKRVSLVPPKMSEAVLPKLGSAPAACEPKTMVDLAAPDCRWPVSGEKANTLFCAMPADEGSSYCLHHRCVSRGKGTVSERTAHRILRRAA